ncbi:MAG: transcriptional repressor LexA [Thermodesulfobacteriota bacterium]
MPSTLSQRQQRLLSYLESNIAEGKTPSLRQAAADLGVSHAAIAQLLDALAGKGYLRREGRYSRAIRLLRPQHSRPAGGQGQEVPVVGRIRAGLPLYAQQEYDGSVLVDGRLFRGKGLFALRVQGDSMRDAGILAGDLVICEPRQYAASGEIVVALVHGDEATVKRFFLHADHVELRPENPRYPKMKLAFGDILVQGRVIGVLRDRLEGG